MSRRNLNAVLGAFLANIRGSRRLAADADRWSSGNSRGGVRLISGERRHSLYEFAFLKAFLGWETFLEDSFILYLVGRAPVRGRPPVRYAFPPSRRAAVAWVLPEHREYAEWAKAADVIVRANRFFRDGRPFTPVLQSIQNALEEMRKIRNAIAHVSASSQEKFEQVARLRLGVVPHDLTVGRFLAMDVPRASPPSCFLEVYFAKLEFCARRIAGG
jgi:hypothetical protein